MNYYVDNINGNNSSTGTKDTPVADIATALNLLKASKEAGVIILKESETPYLLYSLAEPMNIGYDVTIIGQTLVTISAQKCEACSTSTNNIMFINLILQPHTSFDGDIRALLYLDANNQIYYKRFYNCLFQTNGYFPGSIFVYGANNHYPDTKLYYTNCTFNGRGLELGTQHLNYCTYNVNFGSITIDGANNSMNMNAEGLGYQYYDNLKKDYPDYYKLLLNITGPSETIKASILNAIKNHEMFKYIVSYEEEQIWQEHLNLM